MRYFLMLLLASASWAQVHTVPQVGLTFVDSLSGTNVTTVATGTTVEWQWGTGNHTVTSGTGSTDPQSGLLFDAPLTSTNQTFSYTFTIAGTYPYYCVPHEPQGHNGTVIVTGPTLDVQTPGQGQVNINVSGFTPGGTWLLLVSFAPSTPTGSGPLFGIGGDAWSQILSPLLQGPVGSTGAGGVNLTGIIPGLNVDVVALDLAPGPIFIGRSNALNVLTL